MYHFQKMLCCKTLQLLVCNKLFHHCSMIQCLQICSKNNRVSLKSSKMEIFRFKSSAKLPANSLSSEADHLNLSLYSGSQKQNRNYENCYSNLSENKNEEERQKLFHTLEAGIALNDLDSADLSLVIERFGLEGLNIDYIYNHGIKISADLSSLMFPFDTLNKEFAAIQFATFKKDNSQVTVHNSFSKSVTSIVFGWSLVGLAEKEIIIVSDPLDAIAVNQETHIPTISLPCNFTNFSPELINILRNFHKVIFWLKSKLPSLEGHNLCQFFGKRAFYIRPQDYPNSLKCLQSGFEIKSILKKAYPMYDEGVETMKKHQGILFKRIQKPETYSGVKWKRFSALNEILKGFRKGELTIFTGQTGTGKTTFMSEYSLDLCVQGVPTLWANFEINNEKLFETMLNQYARCSLAENVEAFHHLFEKFGELPMFFLNEDGRKSLTRMLQCMKIYVRVHDVQHIVIDNLQFLMNIENCKSMHDRYGRQDEIYGIFRNFATGYGCHITLVIHPRKEDEFAELNNASISGTAKATQEADNILILQTRKTRQYLQITKNRFAGIKGCVIIEFDKKSQTFKQQKIPLDHQELKKV